jgi:hypothetical protein
LVRGFRVAKAFAFAMMEKLMMEKI